jgi:hypothetical protein
MVKRHAMRRRRRHHCFPANRLLRVAFQISAVALGIIVLLGVLDAITSSGYIEGWAFDTESPWRPLPVTVLGDGKPLAQGLANRYRWDLFDAGCGNGWCAFRVAVNGPVNRLRRASISLWDAPRQIAIHEVSALPLTEDQEPGLSNLEAIIASDPTVVTTIKQLRGCGNAFSQYIASHGAQGFVRAAYVYVLGRPADNSGLTAYAELLRTGAISPFDLLQILYESEEFRAGQRQLIAPTEPGFVFHQL